MVRHGWEEHGGKKPKVMMRILTRHQKPLERLTTEAVKILELSRGPPENDLNGKSEWGQPRVPKITVKMPGDKKPATPGADPNNIPLQYYLAQLETNQKGKPGKVGKIKIAWRHSGETDEETSEKEHKRLRRDSHTPTLTPTLAPDDTTETPHNNTNAEEANTLVEKEETQIQANP